LSLSAVVSPVDAAKRANLAVIDIFRDLGPDDVALLAQAAETRHCPQGVLLYAQGDPVAGLFLLARGRVKLYRLSFSGKRLELTTIQAGSFFGEVPVGGGATHHAYAEAAETCLIYCLRTVDVERLLRDRPQVALRIMETLSRRLAQSEARLAEIAYYCVSTRVAAALVRLSRGREGSLRITHQEIGDMVGAIRESVTKSLDELQTEGVVELRRGRVVVRDPRSLQRRLRA
jgi:CRP/FNR family transcriptional regulator